MKNGKYLGRRLGRCYFTCVWGVICREEKPHCVELFRVVEALLRCFLRTPAGGMFSFFPCLPYEAGKRGFARPRIRIRGPITNNLPRAMKLNHREDLHDVKALWNAVAKQVEEQRLLLGVYTDILRMVC